MFVEKYTITTFRADAQSLKKLRTAYKGMNTSALIRVAIQHMLKTNPRIVDGPHTEDDKQTTRQDNGTYCRSVKSIKGSFVACVLPRGHEEDHEYERGNNGQ